ncbi:MAG: hypothetical protein ACLFV0_11310 [Nitriliruptoraceae bacterium]
MKKYFAAAIVAVMVFAFSAFAAELDVEAGVLQAGVYDELTCTEDDAIVSWGTQHTGQFEEIGQAVNRVTIDFGDGDCEGLYAQVALFSHEQLDGPSTGISNFRLADGNFEIGDNNQVTIDGFQIDPELIDQISVLVKDNLTETEQNFRSGAFATDA